MFNILSSFNWGYFGIGVAVIALLVVGIILFVKFGWFRKLVYGLVTKAEIVIDGSGLGEKKKEEVTNWIYEKLPKEIKWLITPKYISKAIDKAVAYMNKFLKEQAEREEKELDPVEDKKEK